MLEKGTNMQSCKNGNWLGGRIWTYAPNVSWMDLMVAPYLIKLPTIETSSIAKNTKQTLEIGHHLPTRCSLFYCMFNFFENEEGRRKTWTSGTMQQASMCPRCIQFPQDWCEIEGRGGGLREKHIKLDILNPP